MQAVLHHLGLTKPTTPDLFFLHQLLERYTATVPWGSVCRIAQQARHPDHKARARFVDRFWADVIEHGGDGTCFESNYAFFALLQWLGYEGYLTLNNMGATVGCHSAIVLHLDGGKWLVDVGLPIYAPLPLDADHITKAESAWHEYAVLPMGDGVHYNIERSHHSDVNCFTLVDTPVDDATYRACLIRDHEPDGFFLDKVILNKVIDGVVWRYNGREETPQLQVFPPKGQKQVHPIMGDMAQNLADKFCVDAFVLRAALAQAEQNEVKRD